MPAFITSFRTRTFSIGEKSSSSIPAPGANRRFHRPHWLQRWLINFTLATLVLSPLQGLAKAPPWAYASSNTSGVATAQDSRLVQFRKNLEQLRNSLDRSEFDLEALLDKLEYEPVKLVRFMHENIAFEPYAGLLRGSQGTLMSRSGNALDQAVLLAKLINDSGWQARIARTQLTDLQALKLALEVRQPTTPTPLLTQAAFRQSFQRLLTDLGVPEEKITQQVQALSQPPDFSQLPQFKAAEKNRAMLSAALEQAGMPLKAKNITPQLLKTVKDYFWVEYRLDESQPWTAAHPVFANPEKAFKNLSKTEVMADTVPENLLHKVRFSAFLERRVGQKLETERVFGPWEKPASQLVGLTIGYANIPSGMGGLKNGFDPLSVAKNSHFLWPTLSVANNQPLSANRVFDLSGVLLDKAAAASPMAGVLQAVGKKTDTAANVLAGLGKPSLPTDKKTPSQTAEPVKPPGRLREITAQWIELTLIAPDGTEKTLRRYLLDRLGPEQRASDNPTPEKPLNEAESLWQLASPSSFLISPGRYPDAYLIDRYVQNLEKLLPVLAAKKQELSLQALNQAVGKIHDHRPLQLAAGFDALGRKNETGPVLRTHPAVVFQHNRFRLQKTTSSQPARLQVQRIIDIAEYPDRVLQVTPLGILTHPQQTALSGTWATRIEQDAEQVLDPKATHRLNVDIAFEKARKQGAKITVLKQPKQFASSPLRAKLPAISRAAIARDLQAGYVVVLPDKPAPEAIGWWRINPHSGESLGRIGEGLGGESAEFVTIMDLVALKLAAVMSIVSYSDCMRSGGCSNAGCLRGAALGFLISLGIIRFGTFITNKLGELTMAGALGSEMSTRFLGTMTLPDMPFSPPSCIEVE